MEKNIGYKHASRIDSTCFSVSVNAYGNSRKREREGAREIETEREEVKRTQKYKEFHQNDDAQDARCVYIWSREHA
jgi:hypothetical protein